MARTAATQSGQTGLPTGSVPSVSRAYLFAISALLFGLPLLTAYYNVDPHFYFLVIIPYLLASTLVTFAILVLPGRFQPDNGSQTRQRSSRFIGRINSFPSAGILGLFTLAVTLFGLMRYEVFSSYPYPAPGGASLLGSGYIVLLLPVSILGFSRLLYRGVPVLQAVLELRKYALMALVSAALFSLTYLLLVNQILIAGYNVASNLPPPSSAYPFGYTFTVGIEQPFLNLVYLPYAIIQLSPTVNLLIVPFEVVFAVLLGLLVASNVTLAHYLISRSGLRCSTPGTAFSAFGSVIGLTATCPTCLVPTFLSVLFGGITAAETIYSNVYGATLPPILSVLTLSLSLVYLSRTIRNRGLDPSLEPTPAGLQLGSRESI